MSHRRFRLGDWFVDPGANRLSRGSTVTHVRPRVMDLLVFLASNAGRVVSRHEVLDAVWSTQFVADSALSGALAELRAALADPAKSPRLVETIPKRGYRLLAAVEWLEGEAIPRPEPPPPPAPGSAPDLPDPFDAVLSQEATPVFVARDAEIAALDGWLDLAARGRAIVGFVTGEAGTGKSALLAGFARRAMARRPDLLVAAGKGEAQTGAGDPYLPFREVLGQLTGDLEAAAGVPIGGREVSSRLLAATPRATAALLDAGGSALDSLVASRRLHARLQAAGEADLARKVEARIAAGEAHGPAATQQNLFEQVAQALRTLSARHAVLILLDDMQWADKGSVALLFHLARRLGAARLLLVVAYRPSELTLGPDGSRHPLDRMVNELAREAGPCEIRIGTEPDEDFVGALVDAEPNRLGAAFRRTLFEVTAGHALFTVELLARMKALGSIVREDGAWVERGTVDWSLVPPRMEALIRERLDRLPEGLRKLLAVAAVEGEQSAEVAGVLAHHCERAGLWAQAVEHRTAAGRRAVRLHANEEAIDHLRRGLALLDTLPAGEARDRAELALQSALAAQYGQDPGVTALTWLAIGDWLRGGVEESDRRQREALSLARRLGDPFSLAFALTIGAVHRLLLLEDPAGAGGLAAEALALCGRHRYPFLLPVARFVEAAIEARGGGGGALERMQAAIDAASATGAVTMSTLLLVELASRRLAGAQIAEGLDAVSRGLARCAAGECVAEAELHRLRGDLLDASGDDPASVEACYLKALETAAAQGAAVWEARAAKSLARHRESGQRLSVEG